MCNICGLNKEVLNIKITDANHTQIFCPNCLIISMAYNELKLVNNMSFIDDISKKSGAIKYESYKESYVLEAETMKRLIKRNLTPKEHKILVKKYGEHSYMLHEDFYDENNRAIQPI